MMAIYSQRKYEQADRALNSHVTFEAVFDSSCPLLGRYYPPVNAPHPRQLIPSGMGPTGARVELSI